VPCVRFSPYRLSSANRKFAELSARSSGSSDDVANSEESEDDLSPTLLVNRPRKQAWESKLRRFPVAKSRTIFGKFQEIYYHDPRPAKIMARLGNFTLALLPLLPHPFGRDDLMKTTTTFAFFAAAFPLALLLSGISATPVQAQFIDQETKLTADDAAANDLFGSSVAISGNTALVGARRDDVGGSRSGSAYLFDITTGNQIAKLTADDAAEFDSFGGSVALSGNTALVGARWDDGAGSDSGSTYLYTNIPEPSSLLLGTLAGLFGLGTPGRRRRKCYEGIWKVRRLRAA